MPDYLSSGLQILGSVASLAAIPLSVYLYLRSREAGSVRLRREISRILSYQIGEGRDLSPFEIRAVIESRLRESGRARDRSLTTDAIVEDLVTDTITNPMLQPDRKDAILANLHRLHRLGLLFDLLTRYPVSATRLASYLASDYHLAPDDLSLAADRQELPEPAAHPAVGFSALFAWLSLLVALLSLALSRTAEIGSLVDAFRKALPAFPVEVLIGLFASVVAGMSANLFYAYVSRRRRPRRQPAEPEREGAVAKTNQRQ